MKVTPAFHVFPRFTGTWTDVKPGDIVISPSAALFRYEDYPTRNDDTRVVIVQKRPLLVLARLDKVLDPLKGEDEIENLSTFIVFSITAGILMGNFKRK